MKRLNERYAHHAPALPQNDSFMNPVVETLLSHRSIRAFTDQALPPGTVELLTAAAQSAPSSCNLQMWSVVAVTDAQKKAFINQNVLKQPHVEKAPLMLVFLADMAMLKRIAADKNAPIEGLDYLDIFLMAAIDACLATQNAAIAAESMGLGTVYGGSIRNHPETVIDALRLPAYVFPIVSLSVGYPDQDRLPQIKPRLAQNAVLHRETYSHEHLPQAAEDYDAAMREFYTGYRTEDQTWTRLSLARVRSPESLSGRDRLREALLKQHILLK
jgi:nitroreductase